MKIQVLIFFNISLKFVFQTIAKEYVKTLLKSKRKWLFKASASKAGDLGSIPGSGRSPGEGNGNSLQYSCLENPMDGEAWWAIVHGVAKSWTRLSHFTIHYTGRAATQRHWRVCPGTFIWVYLRQCSAKNLLMKRQYYDQLAVLRNLGKGISKI